MEHNPADSPLLAQAEYYLNEFCKADNEACRALRALVDAARSGEIPETVVAAAAKVRDERPNSSISLLIQKIITGGTEVLTPHSLNRWIAATNAEKRKP